MAVYACFRKLECIFLEVNHIFHKLFLRFAFTIEVSIDTTDIMAVNGCFYKPEYIFYEVNHVFHEVSYQN